VQQRLNTCIRATLTAVGPFQLPAPKSGTLSQISSETQLSVQTVSDVCLKRTCSLDTSSAFSALEVLDDNRALKIYLLTYAIHRRKALAFCKIQVVVR